MCLSLCFFPRLQTKQRRRMPFSTWLAESNFDCAALGRRAELLLWLKKEPGS